MSSFRLVDEVTLFASHIHCDTGRTVAQLSICGIIWPMGKDLLPKTRTPEALAKIRRAQSIFLETMIDGQMDYREVAQKLSKGDKKKAKRWRQRWRHWVAYDGEFQDVLAALTMAEMRSSLPGINAALVRRAAKGNVPAIKLALEASGFYNPRVEHEHKGDISITIRNAPRPDRVEDDIVADAEVVE